MLTSKISQRSYSKEKTIEALKSNCFDYKDMLYKIMRVMARLPMDSACNDKVRVLFNDDFSKEEIKELKRLLNS